jgi:hypothetical protein
MIYQNYLKYSAEYDESNNEFSFYNETKGKFLKNGHISIYANGKDEIKLAEYGKVDFKRVKLPDAEKVTVNYSEGPDILKNLSIEFLIDIDGIRFTAFTQDAANTNMYTNKNISTNIDINAKGNLIWGTDPVKSTYAVSLNGERSGLRTAHGPATSKIDNALYDRITDSVLEFLEYEDSEQKETDRIGSNRIRLSFDWESKCYQFNYSISSLNGTNSLRIKIHENYYEREFSVPFRPINKSHNFPTPPVGWMTWYAVMFNASSRTVLENAKWMAENLKDYGANCIWVDWEWYHSNKTGMESPGVDIFNPSREKYPEGMKYLSDEIKKLGLIPAIWIAATNDTNKNYMLEENPEWILTHKPSWAGQWWVDPTHPGILEKFVPAVFKQLIDWGYEAFKFDSLPLSLDIFDLNHDKLYNKNISSEKALREIIKIGRDIIGNDKYMMSCAGVTTRSIVFAADYFDGARIGGDIFKWDEFVRAGVDRIYKYYLYHNVLWYADADNVVIRNEFNSLEQACSRVSFYGLAGVPVTFGDHLPALEEERVELLKRAIPVVDMHPMDLYEIKIDKAFRMINLNVEKDYGSWNVVNIMNPDNEEKNITVNLSEDLYLDTENGEIYIAYDYWNQKFLGIFNENINIVLPSCESRVFAIHKLKGHPQLISTSRHITQGAYDLQKLDWDPECKTLKGTSEVINKEAYKITLYVPEGYNPVKAVLGSGEKAEVRNVEKNIWTVEFKPQECGTMEWFVEF